MFRILILTIFMVSFCQVPAIQAIEYSYKTLNFPNQIYNVTAWEINNMQQIVGNHGWIGFLYDNGNFIVLSAPQNYKNSGRAINDKGIIIIHDDGAYNNVFYDGTNYILLPFRGAATDMNNHEKITFSARHDGWHRGFIYDYHTGIITQVDSPWPNYSKGLDFRGINDLGICAGDYDDINGFGHGVIYDAGNFTILDFPGAEVTSLWKINNKRHIIGTGFIIKDDWNTQFSFLYDGVGFMKIAYPGASNTFVYGFNDLDQIVGSYLKDGQEYGFVASPIPLPGTLFLFGAGLASIGMYSFRKRLAKK